MGANKKEDSQKPTHTVIKEFHDIDDYDKVHEVGDDVSHLDADRLAKLVELGHVEDLTAKPAEEPAK